MEYSKLRGRIKEIFGQQELFAVSLGVHPATLSAKLQGKTEWKQSEILKAAELLNIDKDDIPLYFFDVIVACSPNVRKED